LVFIELALVTWAIKSCKFTMRLRPGSTLFPYTTLFRSCPLGKVGAGDVHLQCGFVGCGCNNVKIFGVHCIRFRSMRHEPARHSRSEEHTSELQSRENLVCRLLLEKKKEKVFKPNKSTCE